MEISPERFAELLASEVALKSRDAQQAREPQRTSLAVYTPSPDEVTVRFSRFTTLTLNGQLTAYQRGTEAGFPSSMAKMIIAAGHGIQVHHEAL